MDLYAEIAKMFDIPSDERYLNRRRELIEAVGERAYLIVCHEVATDRHKAVRRTSYDFRDNGAIEF